MKLSQIQALIAIAETGSIRAAARRIGLTQPALSMALQTFEEELSVPLVHRTSRGAHLTTYGKAILTRGRGITQEIERLRDEIVQMRGASEGSVTLAISPSPAVVLLPHALARFHQEFPTVQVRIREAVFPETLQMLREGMADIALGAQPMLRKSAQPEFLVEQLYENQLVVTGRVGHPKSNADTLADLLDCEWLLHGTEDGPGSMYAPVFRAHQLTPPTPRVYSESFISTLILLENSDALSLLPERLIRRLIQSRRLMMLSIRELMPNVDVSMIIRANQPLTPMAQRLLQMLRRTAPTLAELPSL
jgi:LysR family transcriptional regulator, regulator of abg operon